MNMPMMQTLNPLQQTMMNCMNKVATHFSNRFMQGPAPAGSGFNGEMERYFADIRDGKAEVPEAMAEVMCMAAIQAVMHYMGEHDAMKQQIAASGAIGEEMEAQHERHNKFKALIEQLRDEPMVGRKREIINAHFEGLTEDETSVLLELATDNSRSFHAQRVRMDVPTFLRVKKEAEKKMK